jgi:hypothetical protein
VEKFVHHRRVLSFSDLLVQYIEHMFSSLPLLPERRRNRKMMFNILNNYSILGR